MGMIKRTYEWSRVVNAAPSEESITTRKLSVGSLIEELDLSSDDALLASCVVGTVKGFDDSVAAASAVETIVNSIREHQQAFPSDLVDNALELRVCAALAVGELVIRDIEKGESPSEYAILSAALLESALGIRPEIPEQFLRAMLGELRATAQKTSQQAAVEIRRRSTLNLESPGKSAVPSDVEALWKAVWPPLKLILQQLESQATNDREELDVLWWLYGNYSETATKHLKSLKPYEAALCAGKELADLSSVPALESIRQMLIKAVEGNRTNQSLKPRRLDAIVKQWNESEMKSLVPEGEKLRTFVMTYPSLFPLTWLVSRIIDSGVKTGWTDEFEKKTGISISHEFTPEIIARQVFDERVAQKICEED